MNKNLEKVKGIKREKGIVKKDISNRDLALGVTGMMVGLSIHMDDKINQLENKMDNHQLINQPLLEEIQEIVSKKVKKKKGAKLPLRNEIKRKEFLMILENAGLNTRQEGKKRKLKLIYFLLYYMGLRVNETHQFTYQHFEDLKKKKYCQIQLSKTDQEPIKKALILEGQEMLDILWEEVEYHFKLYNSIGCSTFDGKLYRKDSFINLVNRDMKVICKKYKTENLTSHGFRIGLITSLLKDLTIHNVSKLMGHKSIESTMKYYRYQFNDEEQLKKIEEVFKNR
jgi:integrase